MFETLVGYGKGTNLDYPWFFSTTAAYEANIGKKKSLNLFSAPNWSESFESFLCVKATTPSSDTLTAQVYDSKSLTQKFTHTMAPDWGAGGVGGWVKGVRSVAVGNKGNHFVYFTHNGASFNNDFYEHTVIKNGKVSTLTLSKNTALSYTSVDAISLSTGAVLVVYVIGSGQNSNVKTVRFYTVDADGKRSSIKSLPEFPSHTNGVFLGYDFNRFRGASSIYLRVSTTGDGHFYYRFNESPETMTSTSVSLYDRAPYRYRYRDHVMSAGGSLTTLYGSSIAYPHQVPSFRVNDKHLYLFPLTDYYDEVLTAEKLMCPSTHDIYDGSGQLLQKSVPYFVPFYRG